jgi:Ca2+-binding EF-hand superfamily protein
MLDADGDQRLSAAELDAVLGRLAKDGPSASERIVVADLDRDGKLDENELRDAAEMRFTSMDRDGDGNLDEAEFANGFGVRVR